ncbi:MAG: hypothetical protein ACOH2V_06060 [Candidatus Saccharimonadaceae bacterium]
MTEKQKESIRLSNKKQRGALAAERRKFGGYFDNSGRRYSISELYMRIFDYKGTITYKRWFEKNFPDDIGVPLLSFHWSNAYHELGKLQETKIYTIDTAFQNIYLHKLLLNREVNKIDMYEFGRDMLEFAQLMIKDCGKVATESYFNWLSIFIETDEYKEPINKFIALTKLLKNENKQYKRIELLEQIRVLEKVNKNNTK